MAHTPKPDKELVARLRHAGLRKKVAQNVAAAVDGARSRKAPPKDVSRVIQELRSAAGELQARAKGGAAPKRSAAAKKGAAKKGAATRKRNRAAADKS